MLPWAHPSPKPKRHLNRFSHFCTAHRRVSVYFTIGCPSFLKIAIPMGDLDPHLIHGSVGPRVLNPNDISIGSAVFAGLTTVIDGQTDSRWQTTLVGPYIVLRCGLITQETILCHMPHTHISMKYWVTILVSFKISVQNRQYTKLNYRTVQRSERLKDCWWKVYFLPTVYNSTEILKNAQRSKILRTSSSAIKEGPRDALSQLKSFQLLHNCTKNHIWLKGLPFHVV